MITYYKLTKANIEKRKKRKGTCPRMFSIMKENVRAVGTILNSGVGFKNEKYVDFRKLSRLHFKSAPHLACPNVDLCSIVTNFGLILTYDYC